MLPGGVAAGGDVVFFDGATPLGGGSLGVGVPVNNGTASLTISTLAVGQHSITAKYSGFSLHSFAQFQGSTSPPVTETRR